jgi:hypothetical protein
MPLRTPLRLAAALILATSAVAAEEPGRIEIEVEDETGETLDLEVASSWLGAVLQSFDIDCELADEPEVRRMAQRLDRGGEGTRYRFRDEQGADVVALRRHGRLLLEKSGEDGETATVEMPWRVAECLMLGREPEGGAAALFADGLRLRVDARDRESRVRVRIDGPER